MVNVVQLAKVVFIGFIVIMVFYALLGSVIPNVGQDHPPESYLEAFSPQSFYGDDHVGPDRVALLEDPLDAFAARFSLINEAESSVTLTTHAIHNDASATALLAHLYDAAQRGVFVRLYTDGTVGIPDGAAGRALALLSSLENVEVLCYNPINLLEPKSWQAFFHDKIMICDDEYLILGGRNIGDRFFAPKNADKSDTAFDRDVLVFGGGDGSVIYDVKDYLDEITLYCTPYKKEAKSNSLGEMRESAAVFMAENPDFYEKPVDYFSNLACKTRKISLIFNPPQPVSTYPAVGVQLRALMLGAQEQVLVQSPYATANSDVLSAFSAVSAANFCYVTNSAASSPNIPAFSDYNARKAKFIATGADIYEYQGEGSIHGKSMVVDGRISAVGSFNLDDRSLYLDTETMLIIDSEDFAAVLTSAIEDIMAKSLLVQDDLTYADGAVEALNVPFGKKLILKGASVFSRLFRFLI